MWKVTFADTGQTRYLRKQWMADNLVKFGGVVEEIPDIPLVEYDREPDPYLELDEANDEAWDRYVDHYNGPRSEPRFDPPQL